MATERIVADVDPIIKQKAKEISRETGKSVKEIISELIEKEHEKIFKGK